MTDDRLRDDEQRPPGDRTDSAEAVGGLVLGASLEDRIAEVTEAKKAMLDKLQADESYPDRQRLIGLLQESIRTAEERVRAQVELETSALEAAMTQAVSRAVEFVADPRLQFAVALDVRYEKGKPYMENHGAGIRQELTVPVIGLVEQKLAGLIGASAPTEANYRDAGQEFSDVTVRFADEPGDFGLKLIHSRSYKKVDAVPDQGPQEPELVREELVVASSDYQRYREES